MGPAEWYLGFIFRKTVTRSMMKEFSGNRPQNPKLSSQRGGRGEGDSGTVSYIEKGLILKEETERREKVSPVLLPLRLNGPSWWGQRVVVTKWVIFKGTERNRDLLGYGVIVWFVIRNTYLVFIPISGTKLLKLLEIS